MTIGQYQRHLNEFANGNLGTAATLDFHANGIFQSGVLNSASCTLTLTPPRVHSTIWIELIQDATGGRAVTFPGTVVGAVPALNTAANASTLLELLWNGTGYLFTSNNASGVSGVSSFNSRSGAVSPAASDYTATQITNTSSVSGAFVRDALNTLLASIGSIVAGVSSYNSRTGAVSPLSGDYAASQVTNDSTVTGTGVAAALNTLKSSIAALVTGVSSFKTRTGAVTPAAGDYAASQVNNDSATVTGTHVSDALDALKALIAASVSGVSSVYGRAGAVVAVAGDYAASKITNDSATVSGAHVSDALDALKALIAASVSGVSSVYGRTGAVIAVAGDYAATKINNDSSTVTGTHVSDALDTLKALIGSSGVISFATRTGAVTPASGDYAASQVTNDSTVIGTGVSGAINTLKAQIAALITGVSSFNGRTGAITPGSSDYNSNQISDTSSAVGGPTVRNSIDTLSSTIVHLTSSNIGNSSSVAGSQVTGALNALLLEFPNGTYGQSANFTLSNANLGMLGLITGTPVTCTVPSNFSSGINVPSKFSLVLYGSSSVNLTIVGASGVTVRVPSVMPIEHGARINLLCIAANEWSVTFEAINLAAAEVVNSSSVSGFSVSDALDTLKAHAFTGDVSIPLINVKLDPASYGGTQMVFSTAAGWHDVGSGDYMFVPIGPLPVGTAGVTIDSVSVWIKPAGGHGTLPGGGLGMPKVTLYAINNAGTSVAFATQTDPSGSVSVYEAAHAITCSFSPLVANGQSLYFLLESEVGGGSLSGTKVTYASVHTVP